MTLRPLPFLAIFLAFVSLPACAADGTPRRNSAQESIRSVGEVVAVGRTDRTMTLRRDDGNTVSVHVSPKVRSFGRIGVGDFVIAEYGRAQAISLKKTDPAAEPPSGDVDTPAAPSIAPPAAAPPAADALPRRAHRRQMVADIIAIDDKRGFVTAKGDKGKIIDLTVGDRKLLASVRIGDRIEIDYIEAVATSLRPAREKRD